MMIIGGAKYPGLNAKERLVEFESAIVHLQMQAVCFFFRDSILYFKLKIFVC